MAMTNQIDPIASRTFASPSRLSGSSLTTSNRLVSTLVDAWAQSPARIDPEHSDDEARHVAAAAFRPRALDALRH